MEDQLSKLHGVMLEILDVIDGICTAHGLHYSLYAGSLLGAVRHQNFIPWDDDLDVCMPRRDYEEFLRLWETEGPEGYVLMNKRNSPLFPQSFSKIRKDHTCFLQSDWERGKYHLGIFVDIFPADRLPEGAEAQKAYQRKCMAYQILTREYRSRGNARYFFAALLAVTTQAWRKKQRDRMEQELTRLSDDRTKQILFIETPSSIKQIMPADLLDEFVRMPFGDRQYLCFKNWDAYLSVKYPNYMQLPPESERVWKHHPIILDFEQNYEELQ